MQETEEEKNISVLVPYKVQETHRKTSQSSASIQQLILGNNQDRFDLSAAKKQ